MKAQFILIFVFTVGAVVLGRNIENSESLLGKRLIKTSNHDPGQWLDEEEIWALIRNRKSFMDITDFDYSMITTQNVSVNAIPDEPKYQAVVNEVISKIQNSRVLDFVREFSSYHTRYYTTQTGRNSQRWLLAQAQASVQGYPGSSSVHEVDHGFLQRSVVARLVGSDPSLRGEVVILGAHLDSVNRFGPSLNAPGADDNASGSVVLLETLRAIVESGLLLKRTVEFQWYAAEEIGLRGSQSLAQQYRNDGVNVVGMLNFDVVGYYTPGVNDVGVFTDNGHDDMMALLRKLVDEYLDFGWQDRSCDYACSDHASWNAAGYPAVMASEFTPHPQMHTVNDHILNMNFTQVTEFIKLSIAYAVEMTEPAE